MARESGGRGRPQPNIVLTGPESCGKTTLASELAARLGRPLVEEYAREYLGEHGPGYREPDLIRIARGQQARELAAARRGPVVADTDVTVVCVWADYRFGRRHPGLDALLARLPPRVYLLPAPDLPWEPDPLRENPIDRERLFEHYRGLLATLPWPYAVVTGRGPARLASALSAIEELSKGP